MLLSIIIPTFNEAANIEKLIGYLRQHAGADGCEIIVADGCSADNTMELAKNAGALAATSPNKGRAAQMNFGASLAKGSILYFVHADTFPPATFLNDIRQAIEAGFALGRYQTKFDDDRLVLKFNAFFTRFDLFMCMGGDQTLFITNELFNKTGGFNGTMKIMEEYEFCQRARKMGRYKILDGKALISARKYEHNSWWRVQTANYTIIKMYQKGASQEAMVKKYRELLDYR